MLISLSIVSKFHSTDMFVTANMYKRFKQNLSICYLLTKFHMSISSGSLVITIKPEAKYINWHKDWGQKRKAFQLPPHEQIQWN
jgi:hypothetical protein